MRHDGGLAVEMWEKEMPRKIKCETKKRRNEINEINPRRGSEERWRTWWCPWGEAERKQKSGRIGCEAITEES